MRGKKILQRLSALLIASSITLQMVPAVLAAETHNDIQGHWAQQEIDSLAEKGIVTGDGNGDFRPDDAITRAEFIKIVNNVFGFYETGNATFADVKETDWFSKEISIAAQAGYIAGYPDGTMRPNAPITRQEAAKIIASVYDVQKLGDSTTFTDHNEIADWALPFVEAVKDNHMISGYEDQSFRPNNYITRAETVKMVSNASGAIYNEAGEYSKNASGNVVVSVAGTTLKDMVIEGDLYIADGCLEGTVTLDNVTVKGRIIVSGAGQKEVVASGSTINRLVVKESVDQTTVTLQGETKAENIELEGPAKIQVGQGAIVATVENNAAGTEISGAGQVDKIVANEPATVNGTEVEAGKESNLNAGGTTTPGGTGTGSTGGGGGGGGGTGGGTTTPSNDYVFTAALAQYSYDINSLNTLTGEVKRAGKGVSGIAVTIRLFSMDEEEIPVAFDEIKTDQNGQFRCDFSMPIGTESGKYIIRIYANEPVDKTVEHTFEVSGQLKTDKSKLVNQINQAQAYLDKESAYTSASWNAFHDALEAAQTVLNDENASQDAIDEAANNLLRGIKGLIFRADKTLLQEKIEEAKNYQKEDYTEDSFARLTQAITEAEKVAEDKDATDAQVSQAIAALAEAMDALQQAGTVTVYFNGSEGKATHYRALFDGVINAFPNEDDTLHWVTEGPKEEEITAVTVKSQNEEVLTVTADTADKKNVAITGTLKKTGACDVVAVTTVNGNEKSATLHVQVVNSRTVSDLQDAVTNGEKLQENAYQPDSWKPFAEALATAKEKLADLTADEAALQDALTALNQADGNLVPEATSSVAVRVTTATNTETPLTAYTMYQDYQETFLVISDTEASKVRSVTVTGDAEGGFEIDTNSVTELNRKSVFVRVNNIGTWTLKARVDFTDGTSKTVEVKITVVAQVNKTSLNSAIKSATALVQENYSPETWAKLQEALTHAQEIYNNRLADQQAVDAAEKALREAIEQLKPNTVDVSALELVWYQGSGYATTVAVPDTVTVGVDEYVLDRVWLNVKGLQKGQVSKVEVTVNPAVLTLKSSTEGLADEDPWIYRWRCDIQAKAVGESDVTATVTLTDGTTHEKSFHVIVKTPVDTEALEALIETANQKQQDEYTEDSWQNFQEALTKAKEALNSSNQQEINDAKDALETAINQLKEKTASTEEKKALADQIAAAQAKSADEEIYTAATWTKLSTALSEAQKTYDSDSATAKEVAEKTTALQNAISGLKEKVAWDSFKTERAAAEKLLASQDLYETTSWAEFNTAYEAVKDLEETSGRALYDAWKQLTEAMSALTWKDTDSWEPLPHNAAFEALSASNSSLTLTDMGPDWMGSTWVQNLQTEGEQAPNYAFIVGGHRSTVAVYSDYVTIAFSALGANDGETHKETFLKAIEAQGGNLIVETYASTDKSGANPLKRYKLPFYAEEKDEVVDIGLQFNADWQMVTINSDPGQYSDAYFQVTIGEYTTMPGGAVDPVNGYVQNTGLTGWASLYYGDIDAMKQWITDNLEDGKAVVKIKLYQDGPCTEPYLVDGEQVEFDVYITLA